MLDRRLNEQISEPEYVSKTHILANRKRELRGKLEAFEHNRPNRFEPAIQFVLETKQTTILLSEGKPEQKRDFLKKIGSNFQLADKSLAVEFKKHWKILAEFNSDSTTSNARQREFSQKSKWRREGIRTPEGSLVVHCDTPRQPKTDRDFLQCLQRVQSFPNSRW